MRNINDITWLPNIPNQNYWANTISGFKWGYHTNTTRFPETPLEWTGKTAILNSGWYDIIGPTDRVNEIMAPLCEHAGIPSASCNSKAEFSCGITLPSLYFELGNYWFEVQQKHYTEWATTENDNSKCRIRIEANDDIGHWSLGLAFMQGWYIIHQYSTNKIGFVPHTTSTNSVPICTTIEACNFSIETNIEQGTDTEVITVVEEKYIINEI